MEEKLKEMLEEVAKWVRMLEADAQAVKDRDAHDVFLVNHERRLKLLNDSANQLQQQATIAAEAVIGAGHTAGVSRRESWEMAQGQ